MSKFKVVPRVNNSLEYALVKAPGAELECWAVKGPSEIYLLSRNKNEAVYVKMARKDALKLARYILGTK